MNIYSNRFTQLFFYMSILLAAFQLHAADIDMNANQNDVAISGYDPVAYFTDNAALSGTADYSASYKNTIYHFASTKNRDLFKTSPEKYAPQFGGYCAMGVVLYKKLDVDPHAWRVVDGKLYFNLNKAVQKKWLNNVSGHITQAKRIWKDIKAAPSEELNKS